MRNLLYRFAPWWGLTAMILAAPVSSARAGGDPCTGPTETVRVAAVVDDLDVALEDGRTLKFAGLDPARGTARRPDLGETARRVLADWIVGRDANVVLLSVAPDRWERIPALIGLPTRPEDTAASLPDDRPGLMNEKLIRDGWARARPEATIRSCMARLVSVEAEARTAGLGLWSDPDYAVIDADDRKGLAQRAGTMALVEGRGRLRQKGSWIELELGREPYGFAATLGRSTAKTLAHAGIDPRNLVGSRLRIRGFLDGRFGPRIDVTEPGQIEVLAGDARLESRVGIGRVLRPRAPSD